LARREKRLAKLAEARAKLEARAPRHSIWQGNARSNSIAPSATATMNPPVITARDAIVCAHEDRHLSPTGC
jgi:hypothetical protein